MGESPGGCMIEVEDKVWVGTFSTIEVYSSNDYTKITSLHGHTGMIHDLKRVHDHIWSCSSDKSIRVWDLHVRFSF